MILSLRVMRDSRIYFSFWLGHLGREMLLLSCGKWSTNRFRVEMNELCFVRVEFEVVMNKQIKDVLQVPRMLGVNLKMEVRTCDKDFGAIRI